uniref:Uncharacterized protein n=1 Tax=Cannabis sativa TaxID=3483 RepID=A0A803Q2P1_CANSA
MPSASQVAAIWVDDDPSAIVRTRDISVYCHSGDTHRVQYYFGCYDLLQYPLLFPHGDTGWHEGIQRVPKQKNCGTSCRVENLINVNRINSATELLDNEMSGYKHLSSH